MAAPVSSSESAPSAPAGDDFPVKVGKNLNYLAVKLQEPFWRLSEVLINNFITPIRAESFTKVFVVFKRMVYTGVAAVLSLPFMALAVSGMLLHILGNRLVAAPYIYLRGNAAESQNRNLDTFLTWNVCAFAGGLPIALGGVSPARERIDEIIARIRESNSDFICLQEASANFSYQLYEALKNDYAHFYLDIGSKAFTQESCLFFASKRPILGRPNFIPFQIPGMQGGMNRGIFHVETPSCWIITTHLQPHNSANDLAVRAAELGAINSLIAQLKRESPKPVFLLGDLNISRSGRERDEYSRLQMEQQFIDPYLREHPVLNAQSATATDHMNDYVRGVEAPNESYEIIDYALLSRELNPPALNVRRIEAFNIANPQNALSDHHALLLSSNYRQSEILS